MQRGAKDVDLVTVASPSEDGHWYTRDACAERWNYLDGGDRSVRNTKVQAKRRDIGGLEIQHMETAGSITYGTTEE